MDLPDAVSQIGLLLAVVVSVAVLLRLARPQGRWGLRLRRRLVAGVPLGTALTVAVVVGFYLVVQGGLWHWFTPMTIPFRAWSYFYPLGMLSAGIAHAGPNHLLGNVFGTLTFGILAEYAWSHFPEEKGSETFTSLATNPYARAVAFAAGSLLAAVFGSLFGLGPVIGFSGVVFAYAGFALVRYPLATIVLLAGDGLVGQLYRAFNNPTVTGSASPSFSTPWWAGIAIQGHAVGFLLGVAFGVAVVRRRNLKPSAGLLWFGALAFAVSKGLWAAYLFLGNGKFLLLRGVGTALVFVLAGLVAAAVVASDRDLVPRIDLTRKEAAVGLLVCSLLALSLVAVPYNLLTVGETDPQGATVEARDYTVFYAEETANQLVAAYDLPFYNASGVTESGVIVTSEARGIWWSPVSKSELAFRGETRVRVGGVGWRETVVVNRTGWTTVGGPTAYRVTLRQPGEDPTLAYRSPPATAEPVIQGRNVSVVPADTGFQLRVTAGNVTRGIAPMPGINESATIDGLRLVREKGTLYAVEDGTKVRVAKKETYN
ncbi:rhomboid family intramembrane serine protease [Natronomonas sp. EA1]|uniref:rhomboid family intramembrane serine protease n=1 Tax=Natronomonas sp. EA1 TaxID=3421655 RepID=UPI003EC0E082